MKFFEPNDFAIITPGFEDLIRDTRAAADFANQKLDRLLKGAYLLSLANSDISSDKIEHFYDLFVKHLEVMK
jgi:hypothetical protein